MDQTHYREMKENLERLSADGGLSEKEIYIFGHCNASEKLTELMIEKGYQVTAVLDNNPSKQGLFYKDIPIISPKKIIEKDMNQTLVCIVSRACEAMMQQLRQMQYTGRVEKLVDYNTFAEYSLSPETITRKKKRVIQGIQLLENLRDKYNYPNYGNCFFILCPFSALGDVYYAMAYLPYFLENRKIQDYVVVTVGHACANIAKMFNCLEIEILNQKDMDELVQAALFTRAQDIYIAHHDRPYTNLLMKALYVKFIPFELMYRCGVFGLPQSCKPYIPTRLKQFSGRNQMKKGKSVILAPYAKSVAGIGQKIWEKIISYYNKKEYQIYTNIVGEEKELPGTSPLRVELAEFQSAVEWAGVFIGVRSGLCDVIREADCRKIVLFPDCYYSDTKWKVSDFFHLEGWENIVVVEEVSNPLLQ